jgi:hypothetical protein
VPGPINEQNVADAEVIPWESEFGISYRMPDGQLASEHVGSKSQAEALVRRLKMRQADLTDQSQDAGPFPKNVAAS